MNADLHVHSTASDGTLAPSEIVDRALARELNTLALTDHDSVEGIDEALNAAAGTQLTIIPALELSSVVAGCDVHILGFFIDHADRTLRLRLAHMRDARLRRAKTMVERLSDGGFEISLEDVLTLTDGGAVGRSHVARALVAAGHASNVPDAFQRLIGRDRPYYVKKDVGGHAETIRTITDAGGVAVIAHPGISKVDSWLDRMIADGLGGIEAYHADHTEQDRDRYAALAHERGLLVTGGSDFHGVGAPNPELGSVQLPPYEVERLLEWGARHS